MGYSQNSLTSCIYDMALGRSSWDSILDILAATFPGCLITVSGDNLATGDNLAFAGIEADLVHDFAFAVGHR